LCLQRQHAEKHANGKREWEGFHYGHLSAIQGINIGFSLRRSGICVDFIFRLPAYLNYDEKAVVLYSSLGEVLRSDKKHIIEGINSSLWLSNLAFNRA
jgi:hypothetical protein